MLACVADMIGIIGKLSDRASIPTDPRPSRAWRPRSDGPRSGELRARQHSAVRRQPRTPSSGHRVARLPAVEPRGTAWTSGRPADRLGMARGRSSAAVPAFRLARQSLIVATLVLAPPDERPLIFGRNARGDGRGPVRDRDRGLRRRARAGSAAARRRRPLRRGRVAVPPGAGHPARRRRALPAGQRLARRSRCRSSSAA